MKWLKRLGYGLLALLVACIPAYWWLFQESHRVHPGTFSVDIVEVRRLAGSLAGQGPQVIRVETVAHLSAPEAFVVAGDGWKAVDLPVSAYELVYRDRSVVLETAFSPDGAKSMSASNFDSAAYSRVSGVLARASLILVTHEHLDHIGGLLAQPDLKKVLAVARLTREQVAELKRGTKAGPLAQLNLSPNVFDDYRPLDYARYHAIAPGVVLIKAPGHTPGSQMVYVRRADGAEFLFLGDVAWRMRNVDTVREKARFVTWLTDEDRERVLGELAELNRLHSAYPQLRMMPGHDAAAIKAFVDSGLLVRGF